MSKRVIEQGYFGSTAMGDPQSSFAERTLSVAFDFSKKNLAKGKTIPLLEIPRGFCIDRISVIQTKAANADQGVVFGLLSDDSKQVGGTFTLSDNANALLRASQVPAGAKNPTVALSGTVNTSTGAVDGVTATATGTDAGGALFVDGDVLCLVLGNEETDNDLTKGAFDLCIHGFETFSEGTGGNVLGRDYYRESLQDTNNVSGGQMPLD